MTRLKPEIHNITYLRTTFTGFDNFPIELQEVLLDIKYNTGNVSQENWSKLHQAIKNKDLKMICDNVHRKDVSDERNKWAKNKIDSIVQWK